MPTMSAASGAKTIAPFGDLVITQQGANIVFQTPVSDWRNLVLAAAMLLAILVGIVTTYNGFWRMLLLLALTGVPMALILAYGSYQSFVWIAVRPDGLIINTHDNDMESPDHASFLANDYIRNITIDYENALVITYGAQTIKPFAGFADRPTCDVFASLFKKAVAQAWMREDISAQ